jgi:hypothetical protein
MQSCANLLGLGKRRWRFKWVMVVWLHMQLLLYPDGDRVHLSATHMTVGRTSSQGFIRAVASNHHARPRLSPHLPGKYDDGSPALTTPIGSKVCLSVGT